jgi:hypothetical protein
MHDDDNLFHQCCFDEDHNHFDFHDNIGQDFEQMKNLRMDDEHFVRHLDDDELNEYRYSLEQEQQVVVVMV